MTRPKPVDSFGPEIMAALIDGSKRSVEMLLPYRKATVFRQRTNQLRAAMRAANHPMCNVISQTSVKILWGKAAGLPDVEERRSSTNVRSPKDINTQVKLVICPADSEFTDILTKAGVTIKPLDPETIRAEAESLGISDVLSDYVHKDTEQ